MKLALPHVPERYTSASQIARVATEAWTSENLHCPNCGNCLTPCPNNTKSRDFDCSGCREQYQLKSYAGETKYRLLGGEYHTTLACANAGDHPSLIVMRYDEVNWSVIDLSVIHKSFITSSCIIPRKPLSASARRAGWQGCVLDFSKIPSTGMANVVLNATAITFDEIHAKWKTASLMHGAPLGLRSWAADVLKCVEKLNYDFGLSEVYSFADQLQQLHPENNNIRPKIRQQLQVLRDANLIEFLGGGRYRRRFGNKV